MEERKKGFENIENSLFDEDKNDVPPFPLFQGGLVWQFRNCYGSHSVKSHCLQFDTITDNSFAEIEVVNRMSYYWSSTSNPDH
jgi:hypothetical protein